MAELSEVMDLADVPVLAAAKRGRKRRAESNGSKANGNGKANGGSAFEQAFRNIDNVLRQEAGCTTELDYVDV